MKYQFKTYQTQPLLRIFWYRMDNPSKIRNIMLAKRDDASEYQILKNVHVTLQCERNSDEDVYRADEELYIPGSLYDALGEMFKALRRHRISKEDVYLFSAEKGMDDKMEVQLMMKYMTDCGAKNNITESGFIGYLSHLDFEAVRDWRYGDGEN